MVRLHRTDVDRAYMAACSPLTSLKDMIQILCCIRERIGIFGKRDDYLSEDYVCLIE